MSNENTKFSNKEYTSAQLEYFKSQEEVKKYFEKKVEETLAAVQQYIQTKLSTGELLEPKNDQNTKYYLMEDGTIFKYQSENLEFYRLDIKNFMWYLEPSLLSLYFDNTLSFKELPDFKDYFNEYTKEEQSNKKI